MSRNKELKKKAERENNLTYFFYLNRLKSLAIGRYKWNNLPDGIDARFLEEKLSQYGKAIFYWEDSLNQFVVAGVNGTGLKTIYGMPDGRTAVLANGYTNSSLTEENSVLIFNNNTFTSDLLLMQMFAERVANISRSIDINIDLQKCCAMLTGKQEEMQGIMQAMEDIRGNVPYLATSDVSLSGKITALNLNIPFHANEMIIAKRSIWNEALTALGISNVDNTKRERLVTDEVNKDTGDVDMMREMCLGMRQTACDQINKMFNLNVSVEFRTFGKGETEIE